MTRVSWVLVLYEARAIVERYDTDVTLRQLFYRLVAQQLIPNLQPFYRRLSARTAEARRDGTFPDLTDETSEIYGGGSDTHRPTRCAGPPSPIGATTPKASRCRSTWRWRSAGW